MVSLIRKIGRGIRSTAKKTFSKKNVKKGFHKVMNNKHVKGAINKYIPDMAASLATAAGTAMSGGNAAAGAAAGSLARRGAKAGIKRAYKSPKRKSKK
jgi:hypothetical protein